MTKNIFTLTFPGKIQFILVAWSPEVLRRYLDVHGTQDWRVPWLFGMVLFNILSVWGQEINHSRNTFLYKNMLRVKKSYSTRVSQKEFNSVWTDIGKRKI